MLSYPLTNRKAKKNSKNRHFFGSWGGSLIKKTAETVEINKIEINRIIFFLSSGLKFEVIWGHSGAMRSRRVSGKRWLRWIITVWFLALLGASPPTRDESTFYSKKRRDIFCTSSLISAFYFTLEKQSFEEEREIETGEFILKKEFG